MLFLPCVAGARSTSDAEQARGDLLYSTYCKGCHTAQMHWRDNKLATDWNRLKEQVQRWQGVQSLGWASDDVEAVAHHLNRLFYHYPPSEERAGVDVRRGSAAR